MHVETMTPLEMFTEQRNSSKLDQLTELHRAQKIMLYKVICSLIPYNLIDNINSKTNKIYKQDTPAAISVLQYFSSQGS